VSDDDDTGDFSDSDYDIDDTLVSNKSAHVIFNCLQCFDTVGWASGRASGL